MANSRRAHQWLRVFPLQCLVVISELGSVGEVPRQRPKPPKLPLKIPVMLRAFLQLNLELVLRETKHCGITDNHFHSFPPLTKQ